MNSGASPVSRRIRRGSAAAVALIALTAVASCEIFPEGGYAKVAYRERQPLPPTAAPEPPPVVAGIGGAGGGEPPPLPPGSPANLTQEMVEEGQRHFATVCQACHGPAGAGTPAGPELQDQQWIHITGGFDEIVTIIRNGVPNPREYPAAMPPMGGGNFTEEQLQSISAYVFALSHAQAGT